MAIRIRSATRDDAPFLAWVMLTASRGHLARGAWDVWVGDDERRALALLECLAAGDVASFCAWPGFLIAEIDGQPAAALCGYDPAAAGMTDPDPAIARAAEEAFGWGARQRAVADARLSPFFGCITVPSPGVWIVEWVATRSAFRRRGAVQALLGAVLEIGRARGFRRSQITLFIDNTPAEKAYAAAGYAHSEEKRDPGFARLIGCPGLLRMTRAL